MSVILNFLNYNLKNLSKQSSKLLKKSFKAKFYFTFTACTFIPCLNMDSKPIGIFFATSCTNGDKLVFRLFLYSNKFSAFMLFIFHDVF